MTTKREQVKRAELTGFRVPTAREKQKATEYILPRVKRERKTTNAAKILCGIGCLLLFIGLCVNFAEKSMAENVILMTVDVILIQAFYTLYRRQKSQKQLIKYISEGEFRMLDCQAFDADPNADFVSGGTVKIFNAQGQYCNQWFLVDFESVKEWMQTKQMTFWLLKCEYPISTGNAKKKEYYELFTERKLYGR